MHQLHTILQSFRPPFLLLTIVCVLLGATLASMSVPQMNMTHLLFATIGALAAHASVNSFNEYFDYKSGLDANTERTPFSGGSGGLVQNPQALTGVLVAAIVCLLICFLVGVYFWLISDPIIVLLGSLGILTIVLYTNVFNRYPWICWIAPGFGFGTLMTLGVCIVLGGQISLLSIIVSLIPLLLTNNLLLLNQFPDIKADKMVGRNTLPLAYGRIFCIHIMGITYLCAMLLILLLVIVFELHPVALSALVPLSIGLVIYKKLFTAYTSPLTLIPLMGLNVGVTLITPIALSVGIGFTLG